MSVSEKIEEAVEGIVRFLGRLGRTIWVLFSRPSTALERLLEDAGENVKFSRPLTFLALGGFVFTLTLSTYPRGFHNIVDIIWFDDEIKSIFYERWDEVLTLSGLLTAAFPVLITVVICSSVWSRLVISSDLRQEFLSVNAYLFGYQTFTLFFLIFLIIFEEIVRSIIPIENSPISTKVFSVVAIPLLALAVLSSSLMPAYALAKWQYTVGDGDPSARRILLTAMTPLYAFGVLIFLCYAASVPGAVKSVAEHPPTVELHFLESPSLRPLANATQTGTLQTTLDLLIENEKNRAFIQGNTGIYVSLILESEGGVIDEWPAEVTIRSAALSGSTIVVSANSVEVHTFDLVFDLPGAGASRLIRLESNGAALMYIEVTLSAEPSKVWKIAAEVEENDSK